jgi:integrase
MARPAKDGWRILWRGGRAFVRFRHQGTDFRICLGTGDPGEASRLAAIEYTKVISGARPLATRPRTTLGLDELFAEYIATHKGSYDEKTIPTLETYSRRYVGFFDTLTQITAARIGDYSRERLCHVLAKTVRKELSFLRVFLRWLHERKAIVAIPEIPALPKKATGTRSGPQRARPVAITPAEARDIIRALPEWTRRIDGRQWPIRARYIFAWETGLRPGTIERIEAGTHWVPGARTLIIPDEDDKARFGRELPLSRLAIRCLEEVAPIRGLIFGAHDFRYALKRAAVAVLGPQRGRAFAQYDFRHGRATQLANGGGGLVATSYVLGHKQSTTTNKYLRGSKDMAAEAIAALDAAMVPDDAPDDAGCPTAAPMLLLPPAAAPGGAVVSAQLLPTGGMDEVRRKGLEPLQDCSHWNLNPEASEGLQVLSHDDPGAPGPEIPPDGGDSRPMGGNEILVNLGRAILAESRAWATYDAWAFAAASDHPPPIEVPHVVH